MPLRIEEVFMFVSEDAEGEGVVGMTIGNVFMPFVCGDKARVDSLRPRAAEISKDSGKVVKLLRFTTRIDLEVIPPA